MEVEPANTNDDDELKQVISVESEANILQRASEKIKTLIESKSIIENKEIKTELEDDSRILENKEIKTKLENDSKDSLCSILKTKLQEQISIGEITPFEAVKKESDTKRIFGTFKESTQLLDLEKYLLRQAQLATKKRLLKKNKSDENLVPAKKTKIMDLKLSEGKKNEAKSSKKKYSKQIETTTSYSHKFITPNVDSTSLEENKYSMDQNDLLKTENSFEIGKNLINNKIVEIKKRCSSEKDNGSGSEYIPSDENDSEIEIKKKSEKRKKSATSKNNGIRLKRVLDDGDEKIYKQRVEENDYKKNEALHKVDHLFMVPKCIWKRLYKYQKVSVKWLWELHTRGLGGLLGDEMGLGKTVQVIAFLAGLDCSDLLSDGGRFRGLGPTLIVCPATLLEQWVKHFHDWYSTLRVIILHQSGTYQGNVEQLLYSLQAGGILVTSYSGVLIHKDILLKYKWHYVILDEGHKIRNPEAKISKIVKGFLTPHRLLLTGSPMQNSLKELWSLFNFILPGKLGTLPAFMEHCAGPITRGGYTNASRLQEATALQVATMLKDAITPYMLRRTKYDIQHHIRLPDKTEQVLFCSLTEEQRQLYKEFLRSGDVSFVLHEKREGIKYRARLLVALTALRKICNHPDLYLYAKTQMESDEEADTEVNENDINKFGHWKRAGKMTVVRSLLKIWNKQNHRVLLFTQSKQMMHILEGLVQKEKYKYLRMDGTTPMNQRQLLISKFNNDNAYFIFLLTTRVGGLGVNLTGANRVIIYDPDWNPATDAQARERAWRIGQDKNVTIYRLITAGTIEEKMYHRQVFKILLSNKVLEDPRQRRLFRTTDLTELFNLNEPIDGKSESDQLFHNSNTLPDRPNFSLRKIEAMKKLASALSKKIGENLMHGRSSQEQCGADNKSIDSNDDMPETKVPNTNNQNSSSFNESEESILINFENTKELDGLKEENSAIENEDTKNIINNDNQNDECLEMSKNQLPNEVVIIKKDEKEKSEELKKKDDTSDVSKSMMNQDELEEGEILDSLSKLSSKINITDVKKSSNNSTKIVQTEKDEKNTKNEQIYWKHKKQKKNRSKDTAVSAMFEGERVSYLIGRRLGKSKEAHRTSISDDQFVLSKLFSKAAVSSAFQHELVLSNAAYNPEQETPLQRVAKETAFEKMDSVRQSRKWCWKPCWDKPPEEYDDENQ